MRKGSSLAARADGNDHMRKLKASVLLVTRGRMKEAGAEAEQKFLRSLSPTERDLYEAAVANDFADIDLLSGILEKAVRHILGAHPHPMRELGRIEAHEQLTGIYRTLLGLCGTAILSRSYPLVWKTYFDTGKMKLTEAENEARFVLTEFPDLPVNIAEKVAGYLVGMWELRGHQGVEVAADRAPDGSSYSWQLTWAR